MITDYRVEVTKEVCSPLSISLGSDTGASKQFEPVAREFPHDGATGSNCFEEIGRAHV
jgi:hypothetical protein